MPQPADRRLMTELTFSTKTKQQDTRLDNYESRVRGIETLGGLAPGDVSDATMASIASQPTSTFAQYQDSRFSRKVDLVSQLVAPVFVAHRGGPARFPEHSMEGYRAAAQAGHPIEPDLHMLADGTLVSVHNSTTLATMTGPNATVSSMNRSEWLSKRIKPAIPGGRVAKPVLWDDILDEFGGRIVIMPEIKATTPGVVEAVRDSIVKRGLERSVIAWSANYAACQKLVEAGICTGYVTGTSASSGAAAWAAAGIEFVAPAVAVTDQHFINFNAAGLKIITYTPTTHAEAQRQFARGAFGVYVDDPWALSGNVLEQPRQTFTDGYVWPGSEGLDRSTDTLTTLSNGTAVVKFVNQDDSRTRYVEQGWAGELPSRSLAVEADITRESGMSTTSAARVYLSQTLHEAASETQPSWLMFHVRRNGEAVIYKRTGGGGVQTVATAPAFLPSLGSAQSDTTRLRFTIDATGAIALTRLDTGASVTVDAASGAMPAEPLWMSFGLKGMNAAYSNVLIAKS